MKVNQKLHQAKLAKWVTLLQDQASSGLPVKEWCAQNDVTIHAYYYWKRLAKEAYIHSIMQSVFFAVLDLHPTQRPSVSLIEMALPHYPIHMNWPERCRNTINTYNFLPSNYKRYV